MDYVNKNAFLPSGPSLNFIAFDPKFLASRALFQKALNCGILNGALFPVTSRVQISLEKIIINDQVNAVEYTSGCDDPGFRKYDLYRPSIVPYSQGSVNEACSIDGTSPPANPDDPSPCTGDVDIKFSSMLVTTQTSTYGRSQIEMITDEGGIIGAITFITWFMGILRE